MTQMNIFDGTSNLLPVGSPFVSESTDMLISLDSETRRQAATDFTRALMENFESEVTGIIQGYITQYLQVSCFFSRSLLRDRTLELMYTGLRFGPHGQVEVKGHRHLPSYVNRIKRIHPAGKLVAASICQ